MLAADTRVRSKIATSVIMDGQSVSLFAGATGTVQRRMLEWKGEEWWQVELDKPAANGDKVWAFRTTELEVVNG